MLHGSKKIKFHDGKDSNKAILRNLLMSFFTHSHLVTTDKKGRVMKTVLDQMVYKLKDKSNSNYNAVLSSLPYQRFVNDLFDKVGPQVKNITGGYIRLKKLGQRENDGSYMVRLEWAHPVVLDWSKKNNSKVKKTIDLKVGNKENNEVAKNTDEAKTVKPVK